MKRVELFTDGSSLGNPGPGGWCAILRFGEHEKTLAGGTPEATNNQMELLAVIRGLEALKEPCEVTVYSDSQYVTRSLMEWLPGWIKKDFAKVKNPDLWRQYVKLAKDHRVNAVWVRGHNGHVENERCDQLAKAEALRYQGASEKRERHG